MKKERVRERRDMFVLFLFVVRVCARVCVCVRATTTKNKRILLNPRVREAIGKKARRSYIIRIEINNLLFSLMLENE